MELLFDLWSLPFMKKALLAGFFSALIGGFYGTFVVQRKLSFLGNGLAHSALGGIAIGLLLSQNPLPYAVGFTFLISMLITWLKQSTRLSSDTAVGIFFSLSVALGLILLSMNENYSVDAFSYLFGSILSIQDSDLYLLGGFLALNIALLPQWKHWAYATFDRDLAQTDLIQVTKHDYLMNALIATTVVVSIKVMGIILLTAFLTIPAASARIVSKQFGRMTLLSILIAFVSTIVGLVISYQLDFPSGAVIVLCQGILFFGLLPLSENH